MIKEARRQYFSNQNNPRILFKTVDSLANIPPPTVPIKSNADRNLYSTIAQMALLKVTNDLLMAADNGLCSVLVLDLSAAFDTIDHKQALDCQSTKWSSQTIVLGLPDLGLCHR